MTTAAKKFSFLLSAALLLGAGCSPSDTSKNTNPEPLASGFAWYETKDDGFAIQHSADWEVKETKGENTPVQFYSLSEGESDTFRENLNVTLGSKLAGTASIEDIVATLEANVTNFKLEKTETGKNALGDTKTITYNALLKKGDTENKLRIRQTFIPGSSHHFILTYTGVGAGFDRFVDTAVFMEKSFREI